MIVVGRSPVLVMVCVVSCHWQVNVLCTWLTVVSSTTTYTVSSIVWAVVGRWQWWGSPPSAALVLAGRGEPEWWCPVWVYPRWELTRGYRWGPGRGVAGSCLIPSMIPGQVWTIWNKQMVTVNNWRAQKIKLISKSSYCPSFLLVRQARHVHNISICHPVIDSPQVQFKNELIQLNSDLASLYIS